MFEFNKQADGSSTFKGTITNNTITDFIPRDGVFTIHEFGDLTGDKCPNIGSEITTDLPDSEGKLADVAVPVIVAGNSYTWTQTGFKVPLEDLLGKSILVKDPTLNVANPEIFDCCVIGKAKKAAVTPDMQTSDHTTAHHLHHQALHAANIPHTHPMLQPLPQQPHAHHGAHENALV